MIWNFFSKGHVHGFPKSPLCPVRQNPFCVDFLERSKIVLNIKQVQMNIFRKFFHQNTNFSVSEQSASFLFSKKKLFWLRTGGWPPPPFMDRSVTNRFFYALSSLRLKLSSLMRRLNPMVPFLVDQISSLQREFLKTRFSRCMLYRHNAAIC